MLTFYKDAALQRPATLGMPKRFLSLEAGITKTTKLWLADTYNTTVSQATPSGASVIYVAQTAEFLTPGANGAPATCYAKVKGTSFTYTGKTQSTLTGVSGLSVSLLIGDVITPDKVYRTQGSDLISVIAAGLDLSDGLLVSLKKAADASYNFPNTPVLFAVSSYRMTTDAAIEVDVQIQVPAGSEAEFRAWTIQTNNLYVRDFSVVSTAPSTTEFAANAIAPCYVLRKDTSLPQQIRILPSNRAISNDSPGFIVGQYRWRDENTMNAVAVVPTKWDADVSVIGKSKFIYGMGHDTDLEPVRLEEQGDSIYLRVNRGTYFAGTERHSLPAIPALEFFPVSASSLTLSLAAAPAAQRPRFVGIYQLDSDGFYTIQTEYRYMHAGFDTSTGAPTYQYTFDPVTKTVTLNQAPSSQILFLGTISGQATDYFDMPVYPVDRVRRVYVDRGVGLSPRNAPGSAINFSKEDGTLSVTGAGPSIPGSLTGESVFAESDPAVAVLYDQGPGDDRLLTEVDLNPAFSGLSSGHVYLQHRRIKADSISLTCDKPQITIPATLSSIINLTAFGPVYLDNDYAMLLATVYSKVPGEVVPNTVLDVIPGAGFTGFINYQDPTATTIQVRTGGDGTATMIYTPAPGTGIYIPASAASGALAGLATTTVANDTIVLPAAVPISVIRTAQEGWLVTLYTVYNNNPLLGMIGADPLQGEVAWTTQGTPGAPGYKTNGMRIAWKTGTVVNHPIQALDSNGRNYTDALFTGNVVKLVYASSIPTGATIGSYFVTYLQRVTLTLQAVNSNVISNPVLLQMDVPELINDNPWLVLDDDTQGFLNQFRLGWTRSRSIPEIKG